MVAYSFKRRFELPIRLGINTVKVLAGEMHPKRQTIRADRKRHARVGEELQLYCAMRTKSCFLIGRARCIAVSSIVLTFTPPQCISVTSPMASYQGKGLDEFARADGFNNWPDMLEFWHLEHPVEFELGSFVGVLIKWEPLA